MISTPAPVKSVTFRVARLAPVARQMAAIWASARGMSRITMRRATAPPWC